MKTVNAKEFIEPCNHLFHIFGYEIKLSRTKYATQFLLIPIEISKRTNDVENEYILPTFVNGVLNKYVCI